MSFDRAIGFTLRQEGGYVHDPTDPGGETNWGISQRAYPDLDIKNLSRTDAIAIYRRDYWDTIRADELPPATAVALFDWHVHSGANAVRALQAIVGAGVDGVLGPMTLAAVKEWAAARSDHDLAARLCRERALYLARWVQARTARIKYVGGFMARLVDVTAVALED